MNVGALIWRSNHYGHNAIYKRHMDISLIVSTTMAALSPLLTKASEKAAETIGEKAVSSALTKGLWSKIRSLFIKDLELSSIEKIESKVTATDVDIDIIKSKLDIAIRTDSAFKNEIISFLNLSYVNKIVLEQLVLSITSDKQTLTNLYSEKKLASIETEGSYEILINRTRRRMEKDEKELLNIISNAEK